MFKFLQDCSHINQFPLSETEKVAKRCYNLYYNTVSVLKEAMEKEEQFMDDVKLPKGMFIAMQQMLKV